jgi:hypothetical protein
MNNWVKIVFLALLTGYGRQVMADMPHIGYAYPAGGQQGSTFEMMIGGQHLEGATNVLVSGGGVEVDIEKYSVKYEPKKLRQLVRRRANAMASLEEKEGKERDKFERQIAQIERQIALADLPEELDPYNKKDVGKYYRSRQKEQFNPQIADRLLVKVRIDKDAEPGERELRIYTPSGLSNPIYFQVGTLPETRDVEPNDDHMSPELPEVPVPSIINGQVFPGDIDHFRFKAKAGDSIVIDVGARRIIPYLADAVPGWFQAVVALYDEDGNEVAYQDDYKFHPDPVLFFDVPETGTYTLSIRDSIYRGREDFIYRIAIGELPFITGIFPLGAPQGGEVDIALSGKNLPKTHLTGTLPTDGSQIRHISVKKGGYRSNQVPFAIGDVPEMFEAEPNNTVEETQKISMPIVINGRIQQSGDRDIFSFEGRKDDSVSIGVVARRLNSPLDSVISLTGPGIEEPVRNDDYEDKDKTHLHLGAGLLTHHADSYLRYELPATGTYFVEIADAQSHWGNDHGYRLHVGLSRPDFKLRMEPSGLHIAPGGTAAFTVRASRIDGFNGEIKLQAKNLPDGFEVSEAEIYPGTDSTRLTITAPRKLESKTISPEIEGEAVIDNKRISRVAVPVDDQMQAFLYRHLVPAQELLLAPVDKPAPLTFEVKLPRSGVVELPLGEEVRLSVSGRMRRPLGKGTLKLDNPPEGISVVKSWIGRGKQEDSDQKGMIRGNIVLLAEEPLEPGYETSLVVSAVMKKRKQEFVFSAPAITIKVIEPTEN